MFTKLKSSVANIIGFIFLHGMVSGGIRAFAFSGTLQPVFVIMHTSLERLQLMEFCSLFKHGRINILKSGVLSISFGKAGPASYSKEIRRPAERSAYLSS